MTTQNDSNTRLLWVGAAIVVALILGLMFRHRLMFKPHTDTFPEVTCRVGTGDTCELPPQIKAIWNAENKARYGYPTGHGVRVPFKKILLSGKEFTKTFELPGWQKYQEEHNNSVRDRKIDNAQKEFERMVAWWRNKEADHRSLLVVVDTTGGINDREATFIRNSLGDLRLKEAVAGGDSLELATCMVTADPHAPCERMRIKENETGRANEAQQKLDVLSNTRPRDEQTALLERLRSILAELARANSLPEEVFIYSDGMQFSGGFNFYKDHRGLVLDPKKWEDLAKLIEPPDQELKKFVKVPKTHVTWYKPRRRMEKSENDGVDQAISFWTMFLRDHGATVDIVAE